MRDLAHDLRWLCINTATVRQWSLDRTIDECARRQIRAITPWRDQVQALGCTSVAQQLKHAGVEAFGYCRGGMFPATTSAARRLASDDNRRAVDEAKELGASHLILVVGGLPGALSGRPEDTDLETARAQVRDGIAELLEYARGVSLPLALEPLHPMYAADRSCVNTLSQALDLCDALDPRCSGALGLALDVYHVWWDPELARQIARATQTRLLTFHVSDWLVPTRDLLNDRGMMGDGVIEIRRIRGLVEAEGYAGFNEVEIFSTLDWNRRDGNEVLDACVARYAKAV